ncbi:Uu.00g105340.m01.CDS01 [Anthostomella pinea]|uniref:Uu.00g105340.m01.CDS01 n=1 Tax=Anthostomella pinea TaxID=933095 RepID=A0AAI8V8U6_9PEZI|nr:Uu.00g105340.m01.CDS01 [Anthostomella pinea]
MDDVDKVADVLSEADAYLGLRNGELEARNSARSSAEIRQQAASSGKPSVNIRRS